MPATSWRRPALLGLIGAGVFVVLVAVVVAIMVPQLIEGAHAREKIVAAVSRQLGGKVEIASLRLSWLPLPHVVLEQISVAIPGSLQGKVPSVSVYPRLLSLLHGELRLAAVTVEGADARVELPRAAPGKPTEAGPAGSIPELERGVAAAVAAASALATSPLAGLTLRVNDATLHVAALAGRTISLTGLDARVRLRRDRLSLDLSSGSNLWQQVTLSASIDPATVKASGELDVTGLQPQPLADAALRDATLRLGKDSTADLALRFGADGVGTLRAEVDGSAAISVWRGRRRLVLRGNRLRATARLGEHKGEVTIRELDLDSPRLQLSGSLTVDQTAPSAALALTAGNVDVAAVRDAALFLGGGSDIVGQIFDILRAGQVPNLIIQSRGRSLADLGDTDALEIRGQLADGRVHVPGVGFDLDNVSGDASVIQGVLAGEHLAATMGRVRARDGSLRIGLTGAAPLLNVETKVAADAAELPGLLRHLLQSEAVRAELDRLTDVGGNASGTLLLSGTTADVQAKVAVDHLDVSGRFRETKTLVRVTGGHFAYEAASVQGEGLQVTVGQSSLSQVSFRAAWNGPRPSLDASAGKSKLLLGELYPWLTAAGFIRDGSGEVKEIKGVAALDSLRLRGPLDTPAEWHFEVAGSARSFELDSPRLPQRIMLRSPVTLSGVRLVRDATTTALSGELTAPGGLSGAADVVWSAEKVDIKRLHVRDAQSDATISLLMAGNESALGFKGRLSKSTVDALIEDNHLLGGWIRGDFRVDIFSEAPARSMMEGTLEAEDVLVGGRRGEPLRLGQVSLAGSDGTLAVDATVDVGADSHPRVHGSIRREASGLVASLDLTADHLDWARLEPLIIEQRPGEGDADLSGALPVPVRGTVRVAAQSFTFHGYTWRPLHATVKLSPPRYTVTVANARLCGITTPGTIKIGPEELELHFRPAAKEQPLDPALTCLWNEKGLVTGSFDLTGEVSAKAPPADLPEAMRGHLDFGASNGRIYRILMIARAFSLLSIATGSVGNMPGLAAKGLAYDRINLAADVHGTTLAVKRAVLDGPTAKLACAGSIDAAKQQLDLTLLVAPLRSVDSILSHLPGFNKILGGSLVSVPVKVSGPMRDPRVVPLDPALVGKEMLGFMRRTLKLPVKLLQPLLPGGSAETK